MRRPGWRGVRLLALLGLTVAAAGASVAACSTKGGAQSGPDAGFELDGTTFDSPVDDTGSGPDAPATNDAAPDHGMEASSPTPDTGAAHDAADAAVADATDAAFPDAEDAADTALPDVVIGDGGCVNTHFDGGPGPDGGYPTGTVLGTYCTLGGDYIAFDPSGNAWVTAGSVVELRQDGVPLGVFPAGSGPVGVAFDPHGNAWIADESGQEVTELSPSGALLGTTPTGTDPEYLAFDPAGNLWVTNDFSFDITRIAPDGGTSTISWSTVGPLMIVFDHSGNAWVSNYGTGSGPTGSTVTELSPAGTVLNTVTVGSGPVGMAVDGAGDIWVTVAFANQVTRLTPSGTVEPGFPVSVGSGATPIGVAIDKNGNGWIADEGFGMVTEVSPSGTVLGTFATQGAFSYAIAVDPAGYVWVSSPSSGFVSKLAP